jgi:hypothetical protein
VSLLQSFDPTDFRLTPSSAALASLSHYEILRITVSIPSDSELATLKSSYLYKGFRELRSASSSFTDCLLTLAELRLVRWLPISM